MKKITTKMLNVQMQPSRITVVLTDLSCGRVMFQNDWSRRRPVHLGRLVEVAGDATGGPPSRVTIMNGMPSQTFTMIGMM